MDYLTDKEIKSVLLDMLGEFDSFCRKHNLRYSLNAGTLLGAVRHKGFIPWDDDVDVMMPRPDYEKLIELSDEISCPYELVGFENGTTNFPFLKLCHTMYRAQEECLEGILDEFLWLDIFPLDGLPDGIEEQKKVLKKQSFLWRVLRMRWMNSPSTGGMRGVFKRIFEVFLNIFTSPDSITKKIINNAQRIPFENAHKSTTLCWVLYNPDGTCSKEDFDHLVEVEFEGKQFYAIQGWDRYLAEAYGDYMCPPPEGARPDHGYRAWHV